MPNVMGNEKLAEWSTVRTSINQEERRRGKMPGHTVKAKFHYASWFEAGFKQVRSQIPLHYLVGTSFEPAPNQLRTN